MPREPGRDMSSGDLDPTVEPLQLGRRSRRLRQRAAWMYHVEDMTQSAIAEALGIGRVTVARLLADARARNEVRITLSRDLAELTALEIGLEKRYGIGEAIVAPLSRADADPAPVIGAATGRYLSDVVRPGQTIGVGWGKTLMHALPHIEERMVHGVSVVSLLGGIARTRQSNPAEFAWQFSRLLQADCFLIPAPALVDSVETKRALIERCGLAEIFARGRRLDTVVTSVGSAAREGTSFQYGNFDERAWEELRAAGAVGDLLYSFFDVGGRLVDHPINDHVMAIPVDSLAAAANRIVVSGGKDKIAGLIGAIRLVRPTVLITDEVTAGRLLDGDAGSRAPEGEDR